MNDPLFAGSAGSAVRMALPVPVDSLFDYRVPDSLADAARPGCRAMVRFSGRLLVGLIIEPVPGTVDPTLAPVERILDAEPVMSPKMATILREAAKRVLCPVGLALHTALPSGGAPTWRSVLAPSPRGREALARKLLGSQDHALLEKIAAGSQPRTAEEQRASARLQRDGLLLKETEEKPPGARPSLDAIVSVREGVDVESVCAEQLARAPKQAALLRHLAAAKGPLRRAELRETFPGAPAILRELSKRDLLKHDQREVQHSALRGAVERDQPLPLTPDQQTALTPVLESLRAGRAEHFLLHGVTGSGKTEIYLRAIAEALDRNLQALVLVPEITLTHQMVQRLRARFGDALAILHSGLRPNERLAEWQRLRSGEKPIAVGARSALFAPLENLGLIVIDEEHDSAYKNDEGFRYRASELASALSVAHGCPLISGSATPSLESRFKAERGDLTRLVLSKRVGNRPLPRVQLVDLAAERARAPRGARRSISQPLRRAMARTLEDGGQTILFLNRRGFSTQIFCFECGHAEHCPNCEVALVFHSADHKLRCHYCDFRRPPIETCEACGAPETALLGMGTQRLEEETRIAFPGARIARLDRDIARRRGATEEILTQLRQGELDILVGTQLVAKGHDFPGVRLVGVVFADTGLHLPDFRAAERSFQLLTQVAGRAGRAEVPGEVVVQTYVPDHYAIAAASRHDYDSFYDREIALRQQLSYPPFGRIAHLLLSHPEEAAGSEAIQALAGDIQRDFERDGLHNVEILGPAPSPLPRLRGRYRFQLLLKSTDEASLLKAARQLLARTQALPKAVRTALDVDPVNML
ncbi:MAG: primosomal protein N' [Myxococcota bacterium]